ncbi:MAG: hypothetical protein ED557_08350 [Balneola sp.]|nr:MAG: hypothetical protein ED557_08350 [Balneola sp.]
MLFKFLFFMALFFVLMRYIGRMFLPSSAKRQRFNPFDQTSRKKGNRFDQIEEAEYEDLSDKNK